MTTQKNKLEKILSASQKMTDNVFHALKTLFFPVENLSISYDTDKKEEYLTPSLWRHDYSQASPEERRNLAEAFKNRRKVNIGETYTSKLRRYHGGGGGSRLVEYDTKRIDKNTILLDEYIVSTDDKQLLEYAKKDYKPIKYNWVIF